jgi:tetratricopeptide (TPR) repeat protein
MDRVGCMPGILEMALQHHQSGRLETARQYYSGILQEDPRHPDAIHLMGLIAHQSGNHEEAVRLIQQAISINGSAAIYYHNLGLVQDALGEIESASLSYVQAVQIDPHYIEAYNRLLHHHPDYAEAYLKRGIAFQVKGRLPEAMTDFRKAIQLQPDFAEAHNNLGSVIEQSRGDLPEAVDLYHKAIQIQEDFIEPYINLGVIHLYQGRIEEAERFFRQGIEMDPENIDGHFNLSLTMLLKGDFENGWKEYEWRLKRERWKNACPHRFTIPRWDGTTFHGKKLFVYGEQGLGDVIQFSRYLPMVKALGGTVVFETSELLFCIFQEFSGTDKVVQRPFSNDVNREFDYHVPLLSLPGIFKTTLETIPADIPYLKADLIKTGDWKQRFGDEEIRIGIVWAGNPDNKDDQYRSCRLTDFLPLLQIPGVRCYGLQKGEPSIEIAQLPDGMNFINLGEELADFSDTAGVIENLDLIISVDTAVVHLAGAMGKPVWNLRPAIPYWVWMMDREDTPWYPTMRIFRQKELGNWNSVMKTVAHEIMIFKG